MLFLLRKTTLLWTNSQTEQSDLKATCHYFRRFLNEKTKTKLNVKIEKIQNCWFFARNWYFRFSQRFCNFFQKSMFFGFKIDKKSFLTRIFVFFVVFWSSSACISMYVSLLVTYCDHIWQKLSKKRNLVLSST